MPRCLPRPTTLILVTAGNPASIKAARTASTFSGRTTDLIMIMARSSVAVFVGATRWVAFLFQSISGYGRKCLISVNSG